MAESLISEENWSRLCRAHKEYNAEVGRAYDEVLHEVSERIAASGSIGKLDIGALVLWKRLRADTRWAKDLMGESELRIRLETAVAVAAVNDCELSTAEAAGKGRHALVQLPGFRNGAALASALLTAAAPTRMAVYDERARRGLTELGLELTEWTHLYRRYMDRVEALRAFANDHDMEWTARDVDVALYWLGRPS
jgi:hypothetical protein